MCSRCEDERGRGIGEIVENALFDVSERLFVEAMAGRISFATSRTDCRQNNSPYR